MIGAVTGLSILEGVAIGAAAGGLTGAFTDEEMINLGDPIWASTSIINCSNFSAVAKAARKAE